MAININFGSNPYSTSGLGMNPMMSGYEMGGMNNQMMSMLLLSMMSMMTQLMSMMSGGAVLPGSPQFGGAGLGGGSPMGNFLGSGGSGGGGGAGGSSALSGAGDGSNLGPMDGSTTPSTRNFINQALSKQGTPYVWGAEGPNAFDCSGLVCWALKQAGVKGGRTTAEGLRQRYKGSAIRDKNQLKPGDLLFYSSGGGKATHVEIYLGNGKSMGTDGSGEKARVENVNWGTFIGGARVPELNR